MTDCGHFQWGYVNRLSTGEINKDKKDGFFLSQQKHYFVGTVLLEEYKNQ